VPVNEKLKVVVVAELLLLMSAVKENEHIRIAVTIGQRPDLSVITGPGSLVELTVDWISSCWHQTPDERPAFAGSLHELVSH